MAWKLPKSDDTVSQTQPGYNSADYDAEMAPAWNGESDSASSTIDPNSGVKRGLKNRHLSMMALAGIIGPGLLVGAGRALQNGGPASLLIGFGVIGKFKTPRPQNGSFANMDMLIMG